MARYHELRHGGDGAVKARHGLFQSHHTERGGLFPYAPTQNDAMRRSAIAQLMREKIVARSMVAPEKTANDVVLGNPELPSFVKKKEIINTVLNNQVTVVVGPTGSGKSTQVPMFLLEAGFDNIVLTQPRIMASNGVGERIGDELTGAFDDEAARGLVAIQTSEKFEHQEQAKIFVRTDGLEQVMQLDRYLSRLPEGELRKQVANTVIILDEIHESNTNQVGLLALVHRLIDNYPGIRVLVMSATLDAEKYTNYFNDEGTRDVPVVAIEGRPSEVEWLERPDNDAINMIAELVNDGDKLELGDDILLFTSGKEEIKDLINSGHKHGLNLEFYGLDASMLESEQQRAVASHPNTIRVIVSTDIAMTSLTFPKVKYVIDEGIVKNPERDEEGARGLVSQLCSKAEILQRGGRAGRVRPGIHILVSPHKETGHEFVSLEERHEFPEPPIYSADLSSMVLKFANCGIDFESLKLIDPVSLRSIQQAKDKLYNLGAIDEQDKITDLGKTMNKFPIEAEFSRMIAEALKPGVPGGVLENTIAVAAAYSAGGLRDFTQHHKKGEEPWRKLITSPESDGILELQLFRAAGVRPSDNERLWQKTMGLSPKNIIKARKTYKRCMRVAGFDTYLSPLALLDGDNRDLTSHCVASGWMDNIFVRNAKAGRHNKFGYRPMGVVDGTEREISNRSIVDSGRVKTVVGDPRFYLKKTGNGWDKVDIIDNVQPLTEEQLRKLTLRETPHIDPTTAVARDGVIRVVRSMYAGSLLCNRDTVMADVGEIDPGIILKLVLESPGPAQLEMRQLKRELEYLQNLTINEVKQLPQSDYEKLLMDAIRQSGSTELHIIDNKLRELMGRRGIKRELFIGDDQRISIVESAVTTIEVGGEVLSLDYDNGRPVVKRVNPNTIYAMPDEVVLPDGRNVLFRVPKISEDGSKTQRGYYDLPIKQAKLVVEKAQTLFTVS